MFQSIRLPMAAAFALTLAACGQSNTPSEAETAQAETVSAVSAEHPTYSAQAFYQTTSFSQAAPSPFTFSATNGDLLITSDETGVFNAYRVDVSTGERSALTQSTGSPIFAVSWFPADDRFLFTQDGGGDELTHVFVQDTEGNVRDLTPGEKVKAGVMGWTDDASGFFVFTNEREGSAFDVYRYATDGYAREMVYENSEGLELGEISSDGRWVVLTRNNSNADSELFLVDLRADAPTLVNITPHEGDVSYGVYAFTPDNTQLIYGTNEFGEFNQAWAYGLETGERNELIAADWDVQYVSYSDSGRYRVSGINEDASTKVTIIDQQTGETVTLNGLPAGDIGQVRFNRDETAISVGVDSDSSPYDLFHVPLGGEAKRLTQALNPDIDANVLVESVVVRFPSYDGLEVPGLLYRPKTASAENPVPAMVSVHGGPGGQSRKGYNASVQHLVNHGYAVFRINNRGSSGYGKTFFHMDDKRHGEADLGDVVASRDFLANMDWIDEQRIGIMGGSYGGYMVAAALAFEPDVFDVGINIFGVTNWVRTLESIPPWWGSFRTSLYAELGDPATDKERLTRISPLFHAQNIVKPLLVVQGANDPRVLQVESDELVEKVRANEVPVEYVLFDDEGHGFRKRENRITASEAYLNFLNTYL